MSLKLWPAEPILSRPVLSLVTLAAQSSQDGPEAIQATAARMKKKGWECSVLLSEDGGLLFGAIEILAAASLAADGFARFNQCPVMVASGWTDEQIRAYGEINGRKAYLGPQLGIRTDLLGFSPDAFSRLFWNGLQRDEARAKAKPRKSAAAKRRPRKGQGPKRGPGKA